MTCQTTAETSIARLEKSAMMKLTEKQTGNVTVPSKIRPQRENDALSDRAEGAELICHDDDDDDDGGVAETEVVGETNTHTCHTCPHLFMCRIVRLPVLMLLMTTEAGDVH